MPRKLPEVNVRGARSRAARAPRRAVGGNRRACRNWKSRSGCRRLAVFFVAQDIEGSGMTANRSDGVWAVVAGFPGTGALPAPLRDSRKRILGTRPRRRRRGRTRSAARSNSWPRAGGEPYRKMLEAGHATARRYDRASVLERWRRWSRSQRTRLAPARTAVLGWRHEPAVLRLLYDATGSAGRAARGRSRRALTKPLRGGRPRTTRGPRHDTCRPAGRDHRRQLQRHRRHAQVPPLAPRPRLPERGSRAGR